MNLLDAYRAAYTSALEQRLRVELQTSATLRAQLLTRDLVEERARWHEQVRPNKLDPARVQLEHELERVTDQRDRANARADRDAETIRLLQSAQSTALDEIDAAGKANSRLHTELLAALAECERLRAELEARPVKVRVYPDRRDPFVEPQKFGDATC